MRYQPKTLLANNIIKEVIYTRKLKTIADLKSEDFVSDIGVMYDRGRPIDDLTGQIFGESEVIGRAEDSITKKGKHIVKWSLRCSCGKIFTASRQQLMSGKKTTCGKSGGHRVDVNVGDVFGRLTVLGPAPPLVGSGGRVRSAWYCRCSCGTEKVVSDSSLKSGQTRSCGCFVSDGIKERTREHRLEQWESIIGKRIGRLTVLRRISDDDCEMKDGEFECLCDCGNTVVTKYRRLMNNKYPSCGCWEKEIKSYEEERSRIRNRLKSVWKGMIRRCYDENNKSYKNYGARGVTVCDEWRNDFEAFFEWAMSSGYDPNAKRMGCTLDRVDPAGVYSPENCRWTNMAQQQQNKRTNFLISYKGKEQCLSAWCLELDIKESAIRSRLSKGWTVERAFETPIRKSREEKTYAYNGEDKTLHEWAHEYGLTDSALKSRLKAGWTFEEAITGERA